MRERIPTAHSNLLHYTTATGLQGILENHTLWATHTGYVNDSTECKEFFKYKLPQLFQKCVAEVNLAGHTVDPAVISELTETLESIPSRLDSYVISFCGSVNHNMKDGLLSQWRGYGADGGYAIVFDTNSLNDLLMAEPERVRLGAVTLSEVEYCVSTPGIEYALPEMIKRANRFSKALKSYLITSDDKHLLDVATATLMLTVAHKHAGFSEEQEVRAVIMPFPQDGSNEQDTELPVLKAPPREFFNNRNGLLIPYLKVFDGNHPLPIQEVIVGPHPDTARRMLVVDKLLTSNGYKGVKVTESKIPFIGR
jgi:hypothetical protein